MDRDDSVRGVDCLGNVSHVYVRFYCYFRINKRKQEEIRKLELYFE